MAKGQVVKKEDELQKVSGVKEKELNVEELIAKAVAEALEKQKQELEKEKPVEKTVVTKSKYKIIPDSTKVRIKSNISGMFNWFEDRGKVRVYVQLFDAEQEQVLDYDEFRILSSKDFLRKATLAIVDVYSNDDITIEDVSRDVNVSNLYEGEFVANDIEKLFDDSVSVEKFSNYINSNKDVAETVLDVAYRLYRQGKFNDHAKMAFLRTGFNNPNLFK